VPGLGQLQEHRSRVGVLAGRQHPGQGQGQTLARVLAPLQELLHSPHQGLATGGLAVSHLGLEGLRHDLQEAGIEGSLVRLGQDLEQHIVRRRTLQLGQGQRESQGSRIGGSTQARDDQVHHLPATGHQHLAGSLRQLVIALHQGQCRLQGRGRANPGQGIHDVAREHRVVLLQQIHQPPGHGLLPDAELTQDHHRSHANLQPTLSVEQAGDPSQLLRLQARHSSHGSMLPYLLL
jgi:hypothetical protein